MIFAEVYVDTTFEAAHSLPHVAFGHKCGRMHGHSYRIRLKARGEVETDPASENCGMVIDYDIVLARWQPLHEQLDHRTLNSIAGLENPTSENIARWILERMPVWCTAVEIGETATCGCTVRREDL